MSPRRDIKNLHSVPRVVTYGWAMPPTVKVLQMNYLSETVPIFRCTLCEREIDFHECETDQDGTYCDQGHVMIWVTDRPAKWWSVGVYETDESYGGPEEGGWWYQTGVRTDEFKIRVFENLTEATNYLVVLREIYKDERNIGVRSFTETLPDASFPLRQPYYS